MYSTRYSCQISMKLEFSGQIFEKFLNIKFNENQSRGIRVVRCGRAEGHIDKTKLVVAFRNFANAPKETGSGFVQCKRYLKCNLKGLPPAFSQSCAGHHGVSCYPLHSFIVSIPPTGN
jgi:hypothetical protein